MGLIQFSRCESGLFEIAGSSWSAMNNFRQEKSDVISCHLWSASEGIAQVLFYFDRDTNL